MGMQNMKTSMEICFKVKTKIQSRFKNKQNLINKKSLANKIQAHQ